MTKEDDLLLRLGIIGGEDEYEDDEEEYDDDEPDPIELEIEREREQERKTREQQKASETQQSLRVVRRGTGRPLWQTTYIKYWDDNEF